MALPKSSKPNLSGYCNRHRHRGTKGRDNAAARARAKANYDPVAAAAKHQKYKALRPEAYRARSAKRNRTLCGRYGHGKTRAKRAGLEWSLTKEQHAALLAKPCTYCGGGLNDTGSGLDRMDNALGYTFNNVTPCCFQCNRIKCEFLTHDEMLAAMAAVMFARVSRPRLTLVRG